MSKPAKLLLSLSVLLCSWTTKAPAQTPSSTIVEVIEIRTYDAMGRVLTVKNGAGDLTATMWDVRGNPKLLIDAEGNATTREYDGLDRLTREIRPGNVVAEFTYDRGSRLIAYADGLGNTTRYKWDALGRKTETIYPDGAIEARTYDAADNLTEIRDPKGTVTRMTYDDGNRMTARTVEPADGVGGPAVETFAYDGLSRLIRSQSGDVVVERTYDPLSRLTSETSGGRTIRYEHDDAGNTTETAFSNGGAAKRTFDPLNRVATIQGGAANAYRGPFVRQQQVLANGLVGTQTFDAARRTLSSAYVQEATGVPSHAEQLTWTQRSLIQGQVRTDQAGMPNQFQYDPATRLTAMTRGDSVFSYSYDTAHNLVSRATRESGIETVLPLPLDGSGRNRPGEFAGIDLDWDANGNLVKKDDLQITFDFKNRPVRVSRAGTELATYRYDAFNRRVSATRDGSTTETVWDGWKDLETHENGQLVSRRHHGDGLDEIVRQDVDLDGDGSLESTQFPLFDTLGNIVALTDSEGRTIERYEYTPFGEQTIRVDSAPPKVDSVTTRDGAIEVLFSEAVSLGLIRQAIAANQVTLLRVATNNPVPLEAEQPPVPGRNAGRRVVLRPQGVVPSSDNVRLRIEPPAVVDNFQKAMAAAYEQNFQWTDNQIVDDTTPPELLAIRVRGGNVEVEFSEEIPPEQAATNIRVDGQAHDWTSSFSRFFLISTENVSQGTGRFQVAATLADPSANPLGESFDKPGPLSTVNRIVYQAPEPDITTVSAAKNAFGFHGRDRDPVTGWIYMRNRWYDPELGRFVSQDPLGYADGPNMTAFAGNDAINKRDPLGLYQTDVHFYAIYYLSRAAGFPAAEAKRIATASQFVDDSGWEAGPLSPSALVSGRTAALHFAAPRGLLVEEGNVYAKAALRLAVLSRDQTRLGIALHTFADSFSHAGFLLRHDERNRREGTLRRPDIGHLDTSAGGHAPDLPYTDQAKAMRMADAVLTNLQDAFRVMQGQPSPRLDRARLDRDLAGAFAVEREEETLRAAYWKGLISVRFGDHVNYEPSDKPPGFSSSLLAHESAVKSLTTFQENAFLILDP